MREAAAAEAKQISKLDVQIELASEIGLDIGRFIERMSNGSAEMAFKEDLKITQKYGVHGFPTFLVRFGEKEILLRSYQSFESFQSVINSLTGGVIVDKKVDKKEEKFLEFIQKYGKVAPVELQTSFDMDEKENWRAIESLIKNNLCRKIQVGNGFFIEAISNPMSCNSKTGVCNL